MKRYRLKKNVKITILEILCLISMFILYTFATMVNNTSVCAFLWVCIVFVIPGIALLLEIYKTNEEVNNIIEEKLEGMRYERKEDII